MYRLIIRGEPVGPFQHIYVFDNSDKLVTSLGVTLDDLEEVVFELIQKYNIKTIDLSGYKAYMEGIEKNLKETGITTYRLDSDISFRYV